MAYAQPLKETIKRFNDKYGELDDDELNELIK